MRVVAHRIVISLLAISFLGVKPVTAQAGIDMDLAAFIQFGEAVTFTGRLRSPLQVQNATIFLYDSMSGITYSQPVTFDANGASEFRFDTVQNVLRPFATLLWRYEITLADGTKVQSATGSIRYDDDRFAWQTLEADSLRIHWYNSDDSFGLAALNAAQAGVRNIRGFFPPDLTQPVDIFLYASDSDLRGANLGAEAWAAGHTLSDGSVITVTIEAAADQNIQLEQRIPHELMHVLLQRQVGMGYRNIPAWLREGMATLAEVYPTPDYDNVLMDAGARGELIPMTNLCAMFSPQIDSAFLAYAQSRSFTNHLRGQFGAEGLLALARTYADSVDCERGPERAFGVSFAKLERDWRTSLLGQSPFLSALGNLAPYLVLLIIVILFPLIGVFGSSRQNGKR